MVVVKSPTPLDFYFIFFGSFLLKYVTLIQKSIIFTPHSLKILMTCLFSLKSDTRGRGDINIKYSLQLDSDMIDRKLGDEVVA